MNDTYFRGLSARYYEHVPVKENMARRRVSVCVRERLRMQIEAFKITKKGLEIQVSLPFFNKLGHVSLFDRHLISFFCGGQTAHLIIHVFKGAE